MALFKNRDKSRRKYGPLYWLLILAGSFLILTLFVIRISKRQYSLRDLTADKYLLQNGITWITAFVLLHCGVKLTREKHYSIGEKIAMLALSAFFSYFTLLGVYFEAQIKSTLSVVLQPLSSKFYFAAAMCGAMVMFYFVFRLIWGLRGSADRCGSAESGILATFFGKHLYRNCMLVLSAFWLPQYIIRFPGAMTYDGWQSLAMYFGTTEMTTQHPLIWVSIMGKLVELGTALGANWLMPVVICIVQHILSMLLVAYAVDTIQKLGFSRKILALALLFFGILPPMQMYASTVYNDLIYSLSVMLLTIELVHYLYDRKAYFTGVRHLLLTALAVFSTIFRYNGLYTMLAVIGVIGIRELWLLLKKQTKLVASGVMIALLILPLLGGQALQNHLNKAYDAKSLTSRAMLAMPIQQTARCLKVHGKVMEEELHEDLHAVMTWRDSSYRKRYDPRNFDKVKNSFKIDATPEEMDGFMNGWLQLLKLYPATCFMATANQNYYLFSPLVVNVRYYESFSGHMELALKRYGYDPRQMLEGVPVFEGPCKALAAFQHDVFPTIPVLGLTVNLAVYIILLFGICVSTLFRDDRRPLILTVALLATLGITILGPAIYRHPRYIYPIMFSMPLLLAAFARSNSRETAQTDTEETA